MQLEEDEERSGRKEALAHALGTTNSHRRQAAARPNYRGESRGARGAGGAGDGIRGAVMRGHALAETALTARMDRPCAARDSLRYASRRPGFGVAPTPTEAGRNEGEADSPRPEWWWRLRRWDCEEAREDESIGTARSKLRVAAYLAGVGRGGGAGVGRRCGCRLRRRRRRTRVGVSERGRRGVRRWRARTSWCCDPVTAGSRSKREVECCCGAAAVVVSRGAGWLACFVVEGCATRRSTWRGPGVQWRGFALGCWAEGVCLVRRAGGCATTLSTVSFTLRSRACANKAWQTVRGAARRPAGGAGQGWRLLGGGRWIDSSSSGGGYEV